MTLLAFTLPAGACWQCWHSCGAWHSAGLMCVLLGVTKWLGLEGTYRDCLVHDSCLSNTLHGTQWHGYPYTLTRYFPSLPFSRLSSLLPLSSPPCMPDPPSPYSSLRCFTELTPVTSCLSYTGEPRTRCSAPDVGSQHGLLTNSEPLRISVEVVIKNYELRRPTKLFFLIKTDSKANHLT